MRRPAAPELRPVCRRAAEGGAALTEPGDEIGPGERAARPLRVNARDTTEDRRRARRNAELLARRGLADTGGIGVAIFARLAAGLFRFRDVRGVDETLAPRQVEQDALLAPGDGVPVRMFRRTVAASGTPALRARARAGAFRGGEEA